MMKKYDIDFLKILDQQQFKEIFAKIIFLTLDEFPVQEITGQITGGSVNVDGTSALRRTCSINMVGNNLNYYSALHNKFKLEIGVKNTIDTNYPEIIWFPQGIFVCTSWNVSTSLTHQTVSIQGQDKMCLLNGTVSGALPHAVNFGELEIYDGDEVIFEEVHIKDILKNAVYTYGNEKLENIIITDIENYGLELLQYRGTDTLYAFINAESQEADNIYFGTQKIYLTETKENGTIISVAEDNEDFVFYSGIDLINEAHPTEVQLSEDGSIGYLYRIGVGDTAGFKITELTYPGELLAQAGEPLTTVLDKIKNMLGEFEYFYNLEGKFVFQKKRTYINTSWSPIDKEGYIKSAIENNSIAYSFDNNTLLTNFSKTPNLSNLKNDFVVWGKKKSANGEELDIHMRYVIDEKPEYYKTTTGKIYCSNEFIVNQLKEAERQRIIQEVQERINKFVPQYSKEDVGLVLPRKMEDGSWSAGWWDIRDWYEYYKLLTREEPKYSMKEYSHNSPEGRVLFKDAFQYEQDVANGDRYVWLIVYNPKTQYYDIVHGSGTTKSKGGWRFRYESEYDENGQLSTFYVDLDGNRQTQTLYVPTGYSSNNSEEAREYIASYWNIPIENVTWFLSPFNGCSDTHTYLEFLEKEVKKEGKLVYFYSPNFPGTDSYEEAIQNQIEKEYEELLAQGLIQLVDWREIIYQMGLDYQNHNGEKDFYFKVDENNEGQYPSGRTGYEQYYTDLLGFWRQLYDPDEEDPWNPSVTDNPSGLMFWFDFFGGYALDEYSVRAIGNRRIVKNDNDATAIYYKQTPNIIFSSQEEIQKLRETNDLSTGYSYVQLGYNYGDAFSLSGQRKSVKEVVDNLLYQHGYSADAINLVSLPIYYLEPNTRIAIHDQDKNLNEEYIINRFSINLNYNGTMSISAAKAPERMV